MTDRPKQIIPDSEAVARCLDGEMLEILDSHGTFVLSELLELLTEASHNHNDLELSKTITDIIFHEARSNGSYSRDEFFNDLNQSITETDTTSIKIIKKLIDGTYCNLMQPDGKGWQKGKLKLCFEFIPEEPESVAIQENSVENHTSPLDEIRQLSNELASLASIDQN